MQQQPTDILHRTHRAQVELDFITGRKLINSYEFLDEIGRGVYGKVKLARNLDTDTLVAIKIVQRYSKKRRLGRISATPEDKTKREIAILKKLRHPHVVGLIEVIDDPELKKIYMVLEHVELGEIIWRKKGTQQICQFERHRIEGEQRGEPNNTQAEELFKKRLEARKQRLEQQRIQNLRNGNPEFWSLEHFGDEEEDLAQALSRQSTSNSLTFPNLQGIPEMDQNLFTHVGSSSRAASRATSKAPSRAVSRASSRSHTPHGNNFDAQLAAQEIEDALSMARRRAGSVASIQLSHNSRVENDAYYFDTLRTEHQSFRGRSPSMPDSIISHMSSVDDLGPHDALEEDFSYVPCLTMDQIRRTFREVTLGLEYLHYEGIVHRDIKPANLLWTKDHHVKISDFGVSYFGRPTRLSSMDSEDGTDADVDFDSEIELAKTVGTPAFFAPELCYTDGKIAPPKIGKEIDIWSLGVTLYCLVFARIPFLAEDEYQLFKAIATQEVHIPKRRLKPVNPDRSSMRNKGYDAVTCGGRYRTDEELVYEEVDEDLRDLIKGLIIKDQSHRMTIRAIKRHPWVVKDLDNVLGWIDDTDPTRNAPGRIEIDDADLDHAVVPLTFFEPLFERARSVYKKAIGKLTGRSESRKRGTSSTTQSPTGEQSPVSFREGRRASLRGDLEPHSEQITPMPDMKPLSAEQQHPLSQSQTTSPDAGSIRGQYWQEEDLTSHVGSSTYKSMRPEMPDRTTSTAASIMTVVHRGPVPDSLPSSEDELNDPIKEAIPFTFTDYQGIEFTVWNVGEEMSRPSGHLRTRAKTLDHGVFGLTDKHSEPTLALSPVVASGDHRHAYPFDNLTWNGSSNAAGDMHYGKVPVGLSQQQSMSSPNMADQIDGASQPIRPSTSNGEYEYRISDNRQRKSTQESYAAARATLIRRQTQEYKEERRKRAASNAKSSAASSNPSHSCPPSPDDEAVLRGVRRDAQPATINTNTMTPLSIDDMSSPHNANTCGDENAHLSHPSLPALVSGASSVSADFEGDMLERAGTVQNSHVSDSDTLRRLSSNGSCYDTSTTPGGLANSLEEYHAHVDQALIDSDDSDDSDDGLTMGGSKRGFVPPLRKSITRRDTNGSIGSTETAKKIVMS